jgi:excinuclease ABC subunit A
VKYNGKNIKEILDLSVRDALQVFQEEPKIISYLTILNDIGMGYITLGQSATTLSGGEAQRIKLSKALGTFKKDNTLFILDEPSTGLLFMMKHNIISY